MPFLISGGVPFPNRNSSCQRLPPGYERRFSSRTKKADVAEHPKAFEHVGLLFDEPPGKSELLFS
jgi:hypothetical protein